VQQGHDVRCIPVLTGYNHDQIYDIIAIAAKLGMESIFVDRYEDGGIGSQQSQDRKLKPSLRQFRIALEQMVKARNDFPSLEGKVGFGTAIPYCLDDLLIKEGLASNCGVGDSFCAINPYGEIRMCNQSQLVFGNILEDELPEVWQSSNMDIFRDLSWVTEPCLSCPLLTHCTGGCKVDANCSSTFCIDYAVRNKEVDYSKLTGFKEPELVITYPNEYRILKPNRFMKLNTTYGTPLLVTRYQTIELDELALQMAQYVMHKGLVSERQLIEMFSPQTEPSNIRTFASQMIQANAFEIGG
jgi:radical SAM protein with 4Fe4S-binding SPASM domain